MTPSQVALNQAKVDQAYGTSGLAESFQAMVDKLRPKWDARIAREDAARAAAVIAFGKSQGFSKVKPDTIEDYRRRLRTWDHHTLWSDDPEEALAATHKRDELDRLAKKFDPDFAIWREIDSNRRIR
jgi:hypothetical protein